MKKIILACCVFLLSACSSQFAYNNLDWLVHWYIDDYIELEKSQEKAFDTRFARWHSWHRQEELVKYEQHLKNLKAIMDEGNFTADDVIAQFDLGRGHWERFRAHITSDIAELAYMLTDEQIIDLFDTLEEKNKEDEEERMEMSPEEIQELFEEIFEDQLKDYFGKLTKSQKELVKQRVPEFVPNRLEWIKYRRNILAASKELLMARKENPNFAQDFAALFTNPDAYKHETYIKNSDHNRAVFAQMLVDAYQTLTPKQKKRLYRKVNNFIEDFSELREDS